MFQSRSSVVRTVALAAAALTLGGPSSALAAETPSNPDPRCQVASPPAWCSVEAEETIEVTASRGTGSTGPVTTPKPSREPVEVPLPDPLSPPVGGPATVDEDPCPGLLAEAADQLQGLEKLIDAWAAHGVEFRVDTEAIWYRYAAFAWAGRSQPLTIADVSSSDAANRAALRALESQLAELYAALQLAAYAGCAQPR